jgi:hypothetical protein
MTVIDSFTFVTRTPGWLKKVLLGSIITAIPFFGSAISNGYQMEVFRNLLNESPNPLPEWKNTGNLFANGLRLLLAVYMLYIPGVILSAIGWILGFSRFLTIVRMLYDVDYQTRMGVNIGTYVGREIVLLLLSLVLGLVLPVAFFFVPAMMRGCAKRNSTLSALNFPAHFKFILNHLGAYLTAYIAVLIALFIFSVLFSTIGTATAVIAGIGIILGWIGVGLGRFWTRLMWAYSLAQMELEESFQSQSTVGQAPYTVSHVSERNSGNNAAGTGLILLAGLVLVIFLIAGMIGITLAVLLVNRNFAENITSSNTSPVNTNPGRSNLNTNLPANRLNLNVNVSTVPGNANANTFYYGSNSNSNTNKMKTADTPANMFFSNCVIHANANVVTDDDEVLETLDRGEPVHIVPGSKSGKWYQVKTRAGTTGWMDGWDITPENCDAYLNNANRYTK